MGFTFKGMWFDFSDVIAYFSHYVKQFSSVCMYKLQIQEFYCHMPKCPCAMKFLVCTFLQQCLKMCQM